MAAAGLADVGAGDLDPLVLGGRVQHPLQQLAVAGLQLSLLLKLTPRVADPPGQRVADRLQLTEVERARGGCDRGDAVVDPQAREGVGDEGAELGFEAADLTAQLHPREPLVAVHAKRGRRLSFEQIRHSPYRV